MKNPKWHRNEIILALDLYYKFKAAKKIPTPKSLEVINISDILNRIPLKEEDVKNYSYRNPNGVCMKVANLESLDPDYHGKGLGNGSKLDSEIFYEFLFERRKLEELAQKIISDAKNRPPRKIQTDKSEEIDNDLDFLNSILFDEMEDSPMKTMLLRKKKLANGEDFPNQEKEDKINKSKEYSTSTFIVEIPNNDDSLNIEKTDNDDEIPNNDNSLNIEKTDSDDEIPNNDDP